MPEPVDVIWFVVSAFNKIEPAVAAFTPVTAFIILFCPVKLTTVFTPAEYTPIASAVI